MFVRWIISRRQRINAPRHITSHGDRWNTDSRKYCQFHKYYITPSALHWIEYRLKLQALELCTKSSLYSWKICNTRTTVVSQIVHSAHCVYAKMHSSTSTMYRIHMYTFCTWVDSHQAMSRTVKVSKMFAAMKTDVLLSLSAWMWI